LDDRIPDLGRLVDNVEVLPAGLAHNPWVPFVHIEVGRDVLPQLLEDKGAASEVESREVGVVDGLCDYFGRGSGGKLDDTRGDAGLGEDLVDNVVGVGSSG
jgi:hypothetical protein